MDIDLSAHNDTCTECTKPIPFERIYAAIRSHEEPKFCSPECLNRSKRRTFDARQKERKKLGLRVWEIPVAWTATATVKVEAGSLEEAIQKALRDEVTLPKHGKYRAGSIRLDEHSEEETEETNETT